MSQKSIQMKITHSIVLKLRMMVVGWTSKNDVQNECEMKEEHIFLFLHSHIHTHSPPSLSL